MKRFVAIGCMLLVGQAGAIAEDVSAETSAAIASSATKVSGGLKATPTTATPASESGVTALQASLQEIGSLEGQFEQQVLTSTGKPISSSSGSFKLLQPGYFYWRITVPDEQILVASGEQLWHYDVELETATQRNIAAELSQSPLAVLSATAERLAQLYAVQQVSGHEFTLQPLFENAAFTQVSLTLARGVPSEMEVLDHLEQVTRIKFLNVTLNPHLMAGEFTFIPPDGVDVYYQQP
jgi:outer membrane lipoprotein carrier protein